MAYEVIFDTNIVRNKNCKFFLGGREELEKFSRLCKIIIPDIVIKEIEKQKNKNIEELHKKLKENELSGVLNLDIPSDIDSSQLIQSLKDNENIDYETIYLTEVADTLSKMKERALSNSPPFEEKSDKGFKDAYIYFTILEYIKNSKDENKQLFFCSQDKKLQEAFRKEEITVIENYNDFKEKIVEKYTDDGGYFIARVKEYLEGKFNIQEIEIDTKKIKLLFQNKENSDILELETHDKEEIKTTYLIKVESKEISGAIIQAELTKAVNEFIYSYSFAVTHDAVDQLSEYLPYFSNENINDMLKATENNNQILWIKDDEDVKNFICNLNESNR